jgi:hypothetical protein
MQDEAPLAAGAKIHLENGCGKADGTPPLADLPWVREGAPHHRSGRSKDAGEYYFIGSCWLQDVSDCFDHEPSPFSADEGPSMRRPAFLLFQVVLQPIKALFPELAVLIDPASGLSERFGFEFAGAPLGFTATRNEASPLEDAKVFGYGGHTHFEWLSEFGDRGLAEGKSSEDGAPRRIGESRKGRTD